MTNSRSTSSPDVVGAVLTALADPTRRTVFELVAKDGPLTATTISKVLPVTRQAVSKHLEHLAEAGLVSSRRHGRETRWSATPQPLAAATSWFESVGSAWDDRLTALADRADRTDRSGSDATRERPATRMTD